MREKNHRKNRTFLSNLSVRLKKTGTFLKGFPSLKKTGNDRMKPMFLEYFFVHDIPGTRKEHNE
jgi:hypothetical protein